MTVVFLGSGAFGIPCLNALRQSPHDLALVVSQPPRPGGRGRKPLATPVSQWARELGIPCRESDDANATESIAAIRAHQPDLIVVIAFGQKIGAELINLPAKGAINVHASILPRWRGAAPINWAILNGDAVTGVSIITLADKMDAGDVLATASTLVEPKETAGHLHDRLAQLAPTTLLETLRQLDEGTAVFTPQDHSQATLAPKLKKGDGFLDFSQSAEMLERRVRAFWPWPGAGATYVSAATGKSTRVTLARVEVVPPASSALATRAAPGTLDEALNVVCGEDALKLLELKPAGSQLMPFGDFVNGRKTVPGDRLAGLVPEASP